MRIRNGLLVLLSCLLFWVVGSLAADTERNIACPEHMDPLVTVKGLTADMKKVAACELAIEDAANATISEEEQENVRREFCSCQNGIEEIKPLGKEQYDEKVAEIDEALENIWERHWLESVSELLLLEKEQQRKNGGTAPRSCQWQEDIDQCYAIGEQAGKNSEDKEKNKKDVQELDQKLQSVMVQVQENPAEISLESLSLGAEDLQQKCQQLKGNLRSYCTLLPATFFLPFDVHSLQLALGEMQDKNKSASGDQLFQRLYCHPHHSVIMTEEQKTAYNSLRSHLNAPQFLAGSNVQMQSLRRDMASNAQVAGAGVGAGSSSSVENAGAGSSRSGAGAGASAAAGKGAAASAAAAAAKNSSAAASGSSGRQRDTEVGKNKGSAVASVGPAGRGSGDGKVNRPSASTGLPNAGGGTYSAGTYNRERERFAREYAGDSLGKDSGKRPAPITDAVDVFFPGAKKRKLEEEEDGRKKQKEAQAAEEIKAPAPANTSSSWSGGVPAASVHTAVAGASSGGSGSATPSGHREEGGEKVFREAEGPTVIDSDTLTWLQKIDDTTKKEVDRCRADSKTMGLSIENISCMRNLLIQKKLIGDNETFEMETKDGQVFLISLDKDGGCCDQKEIKVKSKRSERQLEHERSMEEKKTEDVAGKAVEQSHEKMIELLEKLDEPKKELDDPKKNLIDKLKL